jgi:hypothetical protein
LTSWFFSIGLLLFWDVFSSASPDKKRSAGVQMKKKRCQELALPDREAGIRSDEREAIGATLLAGGSGRKCPHRGLPKRTSTNGFQNRL